jgi:hypothetical protein
MNDGNEISCDERFVETLSEAVNALQAAGLLASLQRTRSGDSSDVARLEAEIERATHAIRRLLDHRNRPTIR